jgi:aminopeptidase N
MKKIALLLALALVACRPIKTEPDILVDEGDAYGEGDYGYEYPDYTSPYEYDYPYEPDMESPMENYHGSEAILTDLINTKLEVSFDWSKSYMMGKETLTAKPHFYATDSLILDAKGMEIKTVMLGGKPLQYNYENDFLRIKLDKKYTRTENFTVVIDYVAKPDERVAGGSDAIKSDKGLYFINPLKTDAAKMPQIWTQGETEASSVWFPTIDQPNIKTKMEIYITVDSKYTTLSNGKMISSTKNANGTKTDYWKQDLPHAPYLFMMGIGEFKVVKDSYKRPDGKLMEVNYYVEPEWESSAKAIFGETPKMINHFSKLLGVEYPWDKYSQIVVRDYVSGAMENTGAVVFGDYVYKTQRELLDGNDNSTIAHELFHHWFGDLVTAESWSNLTLNESFANYSQYLWDEYRHSLDEADFQAETEAEGYFQNGENAGYHNLVWFDYDDKEDMFDGHSYNKGGRILHMLRSYVGDEAFFAGLNLYLKTNSFKAAEYNQLRLAMEEITGEDLNWFFNQWYLNEGHMDLYVSYDDSEEGKVLVSIEQSAFDYETYFKMPVNISVYDDRGVTTERYWINASSSTVLDIPTVGKVTNVIFDTQDMLLGKITESKNTEWWIAQYDAKNRFAHRRDALMNGASSSDEGQALILSALKDKFWNIRSQAIGLSADLSSENSELAIAIMKQLVKSDSVASVRGDALNVLTALVPETEAKAILEDRITNDPAYSVVSAALAQLAKIDAKAAVAKAESLEKEPSSKMIVGIAALYADNTGIEKFDYFKNALNGGKLQGYDKLNVLGAFTYYMTKQDLKNQSKAIPVFENEVKNGGFYSQMLLPRCFEYLLGKYNDDKAALSEKLENAASSGNANQQAIIKGDIAELDSLIASYTRLLESIQPTEIEEGE